MDTVVGTILVAVILIAIVAAIIYKLVKDKKQGKKLLRWQLRLLSKFFSLSQIMIKQ